MARGFATALQAALAGVAGGASGYVRYQEQERQRLREEEERKRREAMDLITFGERAVEPGPLATRVPVGGAGSIAGRAAGAAPPPPSAIPMPTGPVDFGEAERQLGQEESRPSGTTPLQIGDRTLYIPIGQRARDIKRSEQAAASADALADALARAEAVGGVERRQTRETAVENERTAFNALKKFKQVTGDFDPTYGQYGEDLKDYRQIRVSQRTQRAGGSGGDTMAAFIDKQVADEITRMAREGYETPNPAYGTGPNQSLFAPKTVRARYKPEDLQRQAVEIRSGLRSAFEIGGAATRNTAGQPATPTAGLATSPDERGPLARAGATPTTRQMIDSLQDSTGLLSVSRFREETQQEAPDASLATKRQPTRTIEPARTAPSSQRPAGRPFAEALAPRVGMDGALIARSNVPFVSNKWASMPLTMENMSAWKRENPRVGQESNSAYTERMRAAFGR
jgi:hypothetical protein